MELVDVEAAPLSGEFFCDPGRRCDIGPSDLPWSARDLRHKDHLSAECFEHASALRAVSSRHGDDERVPERRADDCEACTHIAARHLDHWRSRLQAPVGERSFDDGARGAVLHAAPRLHELCLG
jgi:hypothetical protein